MSEWIKVEERLPDTQGYYEVVFDDGTTDEKWFRIRGNIRGWMVEDKKVVKWR